MQEKGESGLPDPYVGVVKYTQAGKLKLEKMPEISAARSSKTRSDPSDVGLSGFEFTLRTCPKFVGKSSYAIAIIITCFVRSLVHQKDQQACRM